MKNNDKRQRRAKYKNNIVLGYANGSNFATNP